MARSERFMFKAEACREKKALPRTGLVKGDTRAFLLVTLQSTQVPMEGG